jgi:hypothetical protein
VCHLADRASNTIRRAFLVSVAEAVRLEAGANLANSSIEVVVALISVDPYIAALDGTWRRYNGDAMRLLRKFVAASPSESEWVSALRAMMGTTGLVVIGELRRILGSRFCHLCLSAIDQAGKGFASSLSDEWRASVAADPDTMVEWLRDATSPRMSTVLLIARGLSHHLTAVNRHGSVKWLRFADFTRDELPDDDRTFIQAFLLALGFSAVDDESPALVEATFQDVYDAATTGILASESWSIIEPLMPSRRYWWWQRDDRPERLRQAVVEIFVRMDWPDEQFIECFRNPETFQLVLSEAETTSDGRRLCRSLRKGISSGKLKSGHLSRQEILRILSSTW